jgi:hypothetical protein
MATEYTTEKTPEVQNVEYTPYDKMEDKVSWWRQPELRKLYLMMPFLFLGSTTLGYDGSLLNGLQAMPTWNECMASLRRKVFS